MRRASPTCDSCGRTSWHTTTDCGRGPGAPGTAPAARSSARCAGNDRRHHVDDEDGVDVAQAPSGAHPGVGASPAERADRPREGRHLRRPVGHRRVRVVQLEGWRCAHETRVTSCPASARWWASIVVCAATPPLCGWVGPTMAMRSAADPVGSADPAALEVAGSGSPGGPVAASASPVATHPSWCSDSSSRGMPSRVPPSRPRVSGWAPRRLYAGSHAERGRVAGGAALQRGGRHRRRRPRRPTPSSPTSSCVDDGSADASARPRPSAAGAVVVRHPVNLGQGAALQTGFEYALR